MNVSNNPDQIPNFTDKSAKSEESFESLAEQPAPRSKKNSKRLFWLFLSLLGPGVIAMLANNDAGGMIEYTLTGAKFGISFFIPLLFLFAPISYQFQELSMRLSAVTGREYRGLVRERFGRGASVYSVTALSLANTLYIVTEYVGMTAGLTMLGLPLWLADIVCFAFIGSITFFMGYARKEKVALVVGAINVVFIVVAILARPNFSQFAGIFTASSGAASGFGPDSMPVFIMATLGNTIAPFMLYFQNSATLDKEVTSADIHTGRLDILIGSVLQPFFAAVVMICGAALAGKEVAGNAAGIISAFCSRLGNAGGALFAVGLFNAGWLAATTISMSTAYTVAGAFGWKRSMNDKIAQAPGFYGTYFAGLLIGAAVILIPRLPLVMLAVFTQIIGAGVLIPDIIFLNLLTSDKKLMGKFVNKPIKKIVGWTLAVIFAVMSVIAVTTSLLS